MGLVSRQELSILITKSIGKPEELLSNIDISDEVLQKVTGQIFIGYSILVAYEIGLFEFLSEGPAGTQVIAEKLGISTRSTQALLSCASSLELTTYNNDKYELSALGLAYLDPSSPSYYGGVFDLLIQEDQIMSLDAIRKAVLNGKAQSNSGEELFSNKKSISNAGNFVQSLHDKALRPAFYWARKFPLTQYNSFADIGGGSGIHSIAACASNHYLKAIVCDRPPVLEFTRKHVGDYCLEDRVSVRALDMWKEPFPAADVHFFGDIFHDWNREQCLYLARKSYDSLSDGGAIILHEMLFLDDKCFPLLTSAYNMKMLVWTEGQQFSYSEIKELLLEAGFSSVRIEKGLGNWSLIIGHKG